MSDQSWKTILDFWFGELEPKQWWVKDRELDKLISDRFGAVHEQAAACELWHWRDQPEGRLAEVIVLDQFSRNIFRDNAQAFAWDPLALALAQEAIRIGDDRRIDQDRVNFLYMPFMHSESLAIHEEAVRLFAATKKEQQIQYEKMHKDIIDRFGRYPHRNEILGRESTTEEVAFLNEPNSSF